MSTATTPDALSDPGLDRRYSYGSKLRSTPFAHVWAARDSQLDRDVTFTLLRDELVDDPAAIRLLELSIATAADLDHPGIARVYDAGVVERDGHRLPWAVGEAVTGPSIDQYERPGDLSDDQWAGIVLSIADQLAATMQYTHATGTVHGNLGPATVRLTGSDPLRPIVKVVDFGPQPAELLVPTDPELTAAMWQRFTRSLEYPSPEQKKAAAPTRRSDIFGFGCVLAALLLRIPKPPLDGQDDPGTSDGPGGATAGVDIDVAGELRASATTAMTKNPVERQHSFLVVQEQLRWIRVARTLDRRPDAPTDTLTVPAIPDATSQTVTEEIRLRPRSAPLPVQRTKRKHPGAILVAVLAGLIVLVIGAVWLPTATAGRTASPPVTIPAVAGKDVAAASDLLAKVGLTVGGQRSQPDARIAAGLVAATDPAAGSQLPTDSAVTLLVSSGPDLGTVPQLVGLSISAAQDALTKSGLAAGAIRYRNGVSAAGVVLGSTPAFGERAPAGSAVALVVASGNQAVPAGLIGQAAEAAAAALTAAGFSAQIVTVARSDVAPGIVVDVAPGQGSVHPLGTVVTLMESRWASPSPSPTPGDGPSTSPSPSGDPDD